MTFAAAATLLAVTAAPVGRASVDLDMDLDMDLGMDLDVAIGQMLMVGFRGDSLAADAPILRDIRTRHLGGVVLFSRDVPSNSDRRNIVDPAQLKALTKQLHSAATLPLLIAVDQEGGHVRRLDERFGLGPRSSARYFGNLDRPRETGAWADRTAATLASYGINLNLAPVIDLDRNPENPAIGRWARSYSAEPDITVRHARAVVAAHRKQGVLTALKHFPGQGSAKSDSHQGITDITNTWSDIELKPFAEMVQSGHCDAVMTAHLFLRGIDPDRPATLSSDILHGLLRKRLGFRGVIISDDLQMKAITQEFGLERAIHLAIEAGVDILMFANNSDYDPNITATAIDIVKRLVARGALREQQIFDAHQRVQVFKASLHTAPTAAINGRR